MDYSNIIPKIENSIAKIIVYDPIKKVILGSGSGFVFRKPGLLVTCSHVVKGDQNVFFAKFPNDQEFKDAKILLRDEEHDLALLRIEDISKKPLTRATQEVTKGIEVLFSGYPLDLAELTTHQGILSSISKDATNITTYLIDGTVNPGNSGCPLMTKDGEIIGVVSAQQRERRDILDKVQEMYPGAISLYNVDMVDIYKALMSNLQLGIGYAIPAIYIPDHKEIDATDVTKAHTKTRKK